MGSFILSLHTQQVTTDSIFQPHSHTHTVVADKIKKGEDFLSKKKEEGGEGGEGGEGEPGLDLSFFFFFPY